MDVAERQASGTAEVVFKRTAEVKLCSSRLNERQRSQRMLADMENQAGSGGQGQDGRSVGVQGENRREGAGGTRGCDWEWGPEGRTSERKWFSVAVTLKGGQEDEQPHWGRRQRSLELKRLRVWIRGC